LHRLARPGERVACLCFLPDGKTLQVYDLAGLVCRYDAVSGKQLARFRDRKDGFAALPLGLDGPVARPDPELGDGGRRELLPASLQGRQKKRRGRRHRLRSLLHVRGSPDGRMVATVENTILGGLSGARYRIRVWEVATGGLVADLPEVGESVGALVFSVDGWKL